MKEVKKNQKIYQLYLILHTFNMCLCVRYTKFNNYAIMKTIESYLKLSINAFKYDSLLVK